MVMAGEQHVDAGVGDRVERQLLRPIGSPTSPVSPTGSANNGWWVTSTRSALGSARAKVSRMNAICSWLMRPSLKVSDRAVLMPSTPTPGSSWNGHKSSSM